MQVCSSLCVKLIMLEPKPLLILCISHFAILLFPSRNINTSKTFSDGLVRNKNTCMTMHDIPQLMNQNALCVSIKLMFATHEAVWGKANSHSSYEHQAAHRA